MTPLVEDLVMMTFGLMLVVGVLPVLMLSVAVAVRPHTGDLKHS